MGTSKRKGKSQGGDSLMQCTLRPVTTADEPFLWEMLYYAAHMDEGEEPLESAKTNPDLAPYVTNWGGTGDVGVIAIYSTTEAKVGAAWARRMPRGSPLYDYADPSLPELAIAVRPESLGSGIGSALLRRLLEEARNVHPGMVLSVRANNPAKRLYERLGFVVVAEIANRVGGKSAVMKIDF